MKTFLKIALVALLLTGCAREEKLAPLSEYESAEVQARAFNFQVYPGAQFDQNQTEILRRAHFILQPEAKEAPPMAVYVSEAPLEKVAEFYAGKYGYEIAPNQANDFRPAKPDAYYLDGDLRADAEAIKPIADKLKIAIDPGAISGAYRGAYFAPQVTLPRVNLQRPFYDLTGGEVVNKTQIVMVKQ